MAGCFGVPLRAALIASLVITLPLWAQTKQPLPWSGCCGMQPWPGGQASHPKDGHAPMGPGMMGSGMGAHMMGGSMARHHDAMMVGLPPAYATLSNPLPQTSATLQHGETVYAANCSGCHGETGRGDGPAAQTLNPPPANLAWLSNMPMSKWDAFMYWSVAEGGAQYKTAMPAFKSRLSKDEIWAVVAYIQARLPSQASEKADVAKP